MTYGSVALRWLALGVTSVGVVVVFDWLHIPAPMLLGPIAVGMAFGIGGQRLRFPPVARACAQGVTGVLIAQSVRPDTVAQIAQIWPMAIAMVAVTLLSAMFAGLWVARRTGIDPEEAIWGFFPGMAGAVIAMSEARNLDARTVAVIQVLRLVTVILGMSCLAVTLGSASGGAGVRGGVVLAICLVAMAPFADRWMPWLPAASMFVPLAAGTLAGLAGLPFGLPPVALLLAYFVIGAHVGLGFDLALMRRVGRAIPSILTACLALLVLGAAMGAGLTWLLGIDPLSGVLATVPGSIDAVAAIAYSEGADLSVVMPLQILRLFAVILVGPSLALMVMRLRRTP